MKLKKPQPELVYDSVELADYMRGKYKFRENFLDDYIRNTFAEYANGTQHTISDEDLASEITDEERKYIDTLLNEFGTVTKQPPDPDYREVIIHYWW